MGQLQTFFFGKNHFSRLVRQFTVVFLALVGSGILFHARHYTTESLQHIESFRSAFEMVQYDMEDALDSFVDEHEQSGGDNLGDPDYLATLEARFAQKGFSFFIFRDGRLIFWSDNSVPFSAHVSPRQNSGAQRKQNGWYYYLKKHVDGFEYLVYFNVNQEFRYQNQYLVNRFNDLLPQISSLFFISDRPGEGHAVTDRNNNYLFSLVLRRETALIQSSPALVWMSVLLAMAAFVLFVFSVFRYFSKLFQTGRSSFALGGFVAVMIGSRLLLFLLKIPSVFYGGELFGPGLYATSHLFPSLGDLFFNVLIITIIAYFLFYNLREFSIQLSGSRWVRYPLGVGIFLLIFLTSSFSLFLIKGLVLNSNLNLDVNFIFNLDIYSVVGFLIIGLIFFAFYFFSLVLCRLAHGVLEEVGVFFRAFVLVFLVYFIVSWLIWDSNPVLWLLSFSAMLVYELELRNQNSEKGFSVLIIALFLFGVIATLALYEFNAEKDWEKRKSLGLQLASEQDPVAEFLFVEIEGALFNDNQLQNLVLRDPYNEQAIYDYLQYHYFYDYWAKYDLQVTVCEPGEVLLIKPDNLEVQCSAFFDNYIASYGRPTISERLIFLDNNTGRNSYIAVLSVRTGDVDDQHTLYHVYLEFDSKFIARDMGFPDLLIDDAIDINRDLINYSYATYKNGFLVNEAGNFTYSFYASAFGETDQEFVAFSQDGFSHLKYKRDDETLIIISRPQRSFLEAVAPFSYLFITFFFLMVVFWLLTSKKKTSNILKLNFRRRLQYIMIVIIVISGLTIGGVSGWFIFNIYENKNLDFLNEKAQSVMLDLGQALSHQAYLDPEMDFFLYDLLLQYSHVFFTDINLYGPDGFLVASSRPKVFEEGLVGGKMNALALSEVRSEQKSHFVHTERIGKLEYLSAYAPIYNREGHLLAYVNLPYFAKQSELRDEFSYFLVAFINIYLLLLVLAVVVALFVSNLVTHPLQLIRDSMKGVQLGQTNEKIQWKREDEIGQLVTEYNRMIDELAVSARLLARNEREMAWREMARQVAHEIKNPLTPMKLSVQYLERAYRDRVPDWEDRLERFSKTMVEQIDNLAVIASEFSHFAQMPAGERVRINLRELVPEVLDLYKDFENPQIERSPPPGDEPMWVMADKNQLVRVFNNLIKNATQAYEPHEPAKVYVACNTRDGQHIIEIRDKGCGIPGHLHNQVFNPYFTTKAKGVGLGLSMVKNIIEGFGGSTTFVSSEGKGSTFFIRLPDADQAS